jgi:PQQ-dependent dehydrogenase (s-GDH family)
MKEVFQKQDLVGADILNDPWEVTYGPDDSLWVTEAKGYKVQKIDPVTGNRREILDLSNTSSFTPSSFRRTFASTQSPWPQGGMMGLAIHPDFMHATSPKKYVYIAYVRQYVGQDQTYNGEFIKGHLFWTNLVRFTYANGQLGSPVLLCDTLRGSNDHNSGRMIIAPEGSTYYLYYAVGDMGAGQFDNITRNMKAQSTNSYEGKILRFNLEADPSEGTYDQWIPNTNPFNAMLGVQSAVYTTGMRNNQGFAYDTINGTPMLFGSSHGPYSDDEINKIVSGKNYGHPLVIGYNDGNYNGSKAGSASGSCPLIVSESANATAIGTTYKDPLFSAYDAPAGNSTTPGTVNYIYVNNPSNSGWPSEGWSGMDVYTENMIPGWKNSLAIGSLKWGRVLRVRLTDDGDDVQAIAGYDTVSYFGGQNRFRDVAFAPNGKDLYVVMDKSTTTSGPSSANPVVPACAGCLQKYTFLGYNDDGTGKSTMPDGVEISAGTANTCAPGNTITIDNTNSNLWVPINGPDGNIVAEIKANGNILGNIATSFYIHSGAVRQDVSKRLYANRSITITPQFQPLVPVSIRLYVTTAEYTALKNATNSVGQASGITTINDIRIGKNSDACTGALNSSIQYFTPVASARSLTVGSATTDMGYVLQTDISAFSTFYFMSQNMIILPVQLVDIKATWQEQDALVQWKVANEHNLSSYVIERSVDGASFTAIGNVAATNGSTIFYNYKDKDAGYLNNTVHYRLKMLDKDGAIAYSKIVTLSKEQLITVAIYPNPVADVLRIKAYVHEARAVTIQVTDMQGRVMHQTQTIFSTGANDIEIDTRLWSAQMYSVRIMDKNNKVIALKQVVK